MTDYWNHNVHYRPWVRAQVPSGCRRALDIGCGDGGLLPALAQRSASVVGVDRSAAMAVAARERCAGLDGVRIVEGDFLTASLPPEFDFVTAAASLHHVELHAGLRRCAEPVAPGGRLAVVGMAANRGAVDRSIAGMCLPVVYAMNLRHRHGHADGMPVRDPESSLREIATAAREILPGVRIRRRLLYRYTLLWTKP